MLFPKPLLAVKDDLLQWLWVCHSRWEGGSRESEHIGKGGGGRRGHRGVGASDILCVLHRDQSTAGVFWHIVNPEFQALCDDFLAAVG